MSYVESDQYFVDVDAVGEYDRFNAYEQPRSGGSMQLALRQASGRGGGYSGGRAAEHFASPSGQSTGRSVQGEVINHAAGVIGRAGEGVAAALGIAELSPDVVLVFMFAVIVFMIIQTITVIGMSRTIKKLNRKLKARSSAPAAAAS